jgi:hypothetical protein
VTLTAVGDGFGVIRRDATEKCFAFDEITIFVGNPITNCVGTGEPTVLPRKSLWGDAMLVGPIWACTVTKEGEDDLGVAIGGSKVEGSGA